jgi:flagellar basal body rod protein FlgC
VVEESKPNGNNLNSARRETSRTFRNKKREYLKEKINQLETNSKNKSIRDLHRDIKELKKCYQPRTNMVKDGNGGLLAYSHNILNREKKCFYQLLNAHGVNVVRRQKWIQLSH